MLSGHLWTIGPRLRHALRPYPEPRDRSWSTNVPDERWGEVRLTGRLAEVPGATSVVLLVHGLGGCTASHYMRPAAAACTAHGHSCLRLNLRGSDFSGEDFYHAGLTTDLRAALDSPELAEYDSVGVWGFSLGGHVVLRYATENPDPRVRAVAAVCAPLELEAGERAIDSPEGWLYRQYLLQRLRRIYRPFRERRGVGPTIAEAEEIKTIGEWDERIVAPRHGFHGASDYYARASVVSRLDRLTPSALLVASRQDPMVTPSSVPAAAVAGAPRLDVRWVARGGHVGFPRALDLGVEAPVGLEEQILGWLEVCL